MMGDVRRVNIAHLLKKTGLEDHGQPFDAERLESTVVGFYFSAHW